MSHAAQKDIKAKLKSGWEPEYFNAVPVPKDRNLILTPYKDKLNPDNRIVITGAGGFIAGALTKYLHDMGFTNIVAVDKKPVPEWYQTTEGVTNLCLDLRDDHNCRRICEGAVEVYNLAADMGGMGFIETHRVDCLINSSKINDNMIMAAYRAGATRYFFSSSACAYNTTLQETPDARALKEADAYPADAERGYGWEKLVGEQKTQEIFLEHGMEAHIARFHNVYGPLGTWDGGREKAPAAIARKVIEAKHGSSDTIVIWGDGTQTRSFMYIDDCVDGIFRIMHHNNTIATPLNLGSDELISIADLVTIAENIGKIKLKRKHDLDAPKGVAGRNSDNSLIKKLLGWAPSMEIQKGIKPTYDWIEQQFKDRLTGKRTVS